MHVENELAEIVTIVDHEFKEMIEEYEEILVQDLGVEAWSPSLDGDLDTQDRRVVG